MASDRSSRLLGYLLAVMGVVMIAAGSVTLLWGLASVAGDVAVTPDADSEIRFYAVWYVVVGVLLLRSLADLAAAGTIVRLVGVGFFAAGCARVVSWIVVGGPGPLALTLMVIELILPLVIIPWHAVATRPRPAPSDRDP